MLHQIPGFRLSGEKKDTLTGNGQMDRSRPSEVRLQCALDMFRIKLVSSIICTQNRVSDDYEYPSHCVIPNVGVTKTILQNDLSMDSLVHANAARAM